MSFPRYEKYKDSGVEWLGEVPESWTTGALKYFMLQKSGSIKTGPFGSHLTSVDMQSGEIKVYNQRNVIDNDFSFGENYISKEKFQQLSTFETFPGDLLVTTRGTIGRASILPENAEKGILHPCLLRLQPDNRLINTHFLVTLIQDSHLLKTQLNYMSNATTIEVIYSETISSIILAVPPISEQHKILAFLDRETAKIDGLIAEQQKLIELLKEKRQAVISHAVTKGLNPDAKMKDSGIEWLGEVPEHWSIVQSRRYFFERKSRANIDDKQLTASQKHGVIYQEDFMELEGQKVVQVISGLDILKHVEPDDFVISMRSFQGGIEWCGLRGCISSAYVMLIPSKEIFPCFFKYLFKSNSYIQALQSTTNLVRDGQALRYTNFSLVSLPLLSYEEQKSISDFLNKETCKIDTLIPEAQKAITLLQERRTALISAAVTGKIDVRGFVSDSESGVAA